MSTTTIEDAIWESLAAVADPEIPAVSVLDMGMIRNVSVDDGVVRVVVLPTFSGCPAISEIVHDVGAAVEGIEGVEKAVVETSFTPPWTTERITDDGRRKLAQFGLAPPASGPVLITSIGLPERATCPFCGSTDTEAENPFGPTPCRAVYYCRACRNPFEQFKPV